MHDFRLAVDLCHLIERDKSEVRLLFEEEHGSLEQEAFDCHSYCDKQAKNYIHYAMLGYSCLED